MYNREKKRLRTIWRLKKWGIRSKKKRRQLARDFVASFKPIQRTFSIKHMLGEVLKNV